MPIFTRGKRLSPKLCIKHLELEKKMCNISITPYDPKGAQPDITLTTRRRELTALISMHLGHQSRLEQHTCEHDLDLLPVPLTRASPSQTMSLCVRPIEQVPVTMTLTDTADDFGLETDSCMVSDLAVLCGDHDAEA